MCRLIVGYWRVPWQLDQFERCPFVADCSGVDPTDGRRKIFGVNGTETNASATDGCIVGTTGILCSSCSPGYNRDANVCSKCTSSSTPLRVAALVIVVLVLLLFWLAIKRKLKTLGKFQKHFGNLFRDLENSFGKCTRTNSIWENALEKCSSRLKLFSLQKKN